MQLTKNFHLSEFKCKDGTPVPEKFIQNVAELAENLQVLRDYLNDTYQSDEIDRVSIEIMSSYRTKSHNEKVKGAKGSKHLTAEAGDIKAWIKYRNPEKKSVQLSPTKVGQIVKELISSGAMKEGGVGIYPTFTHYDVRGYRARW